MSTTDQALERLAVPADGVAAPGLVHDLLVITKARLSLLVLVTTLVGFCLGSGPAINWLLLLHTLLGTALAAACASVLNQFIEADVDRLMARTSARPLPAGRWRPRNALFLGIGLGAVGFTYLYFTTNPLTTLLAVATVVIYLFLYTPLKRRTAFCTIVGALSGAIPPMIGWTAARNSCGSGGWILFGVLFLWQIPHFLAIAWMYRDEYAQAGFIMSRPRDFNGFATALESLLFTVGLLLVTMLPYALGLANLVYLIGAALCGAMLLFYALQFFNGRSAANARRLFFASVFYLPLVLGLLVFTRR